MKTHAGGMRAPLVWAWARAAGFFLGCVYVLRMPPVCSHTMALYRCYLSFIFCVPLIWSK